MIETQNTNKISENKLRDRSSEEVKSDFITIASHQLRTPISAIRWSLDTLLNDKVGSLTEKQKGVIREAYQSNKFLAKAVNDLLRASRLDEKDLKFLPEKIDLEEMVKQIVEHTQSFAKAHNVTFMSNIEPSLPEVYIDPLQIRPIIEGVINNGIRYSTLSGKEGEIEIGMKRANDFVLLTISDNGIGIPQDQQSMIFTRFFRAKNAMKSQTEGIGLDLYIAREIIERSGGKISFTSVEKRGTTFYIYLPVDGKKEAEVKAKKNDQPKSVEQAQSALKQEREFVSITVHELKAPLGMTRWSLEVLKKGKAGQLTSEQLELINQVYRGNERLLVLVRDLLDLSKLQEGRFDVEPHPIDLKTVLNDSTAGFLTLAKKKNITFTLPKSSSDWPKVLGDTNRVTQVVTNLISNAVKYTPSKGSVAIDIQIKTGEELKSLGEQTTTADIVHVHNEKGYVVISVKDSGIGISESDQGKLFGRFFRSKNVMETKTEGTGLGLYITKTIVNLHKGDIWFTSRLGEGSTFYFSLPIA